MTIHRNIKNLMTCKYLIMLTLQRQQMLTYLHTKVIQKTVNSLLNIIIHTKESLIFFQLPYSFVPDSSIIIMVCNPKEETNYN